MKKKIILGVVLVVMLGCAKPSNPRSWPVVKNFTGIEERVLDAAMDGDIEFLKEALNSHPELAKFQTSRLGMTPLMYAALTGRLEVVQLLIKKGADPNAQTSFGTTSLMWAIKGGHPEVAEFILDSGGCPEITDSENSSARCLAEEWGVGIDI